MRTSVRGLLSLMGASNRHGFANYTGPLMFDISRARPGKLSSARRSATPNLHDGCTNEHALNMACRKHPFDAQAMSNRAALPCSSGVPDTKATAAPRLASLRPIPRQRGLTSRLKRSVAELALHIPKRRPRSGNPVARARCPSARGPKRTRGTAGAPRGARPRRSMPPSAGGAASDALAKTPTRCCPARCGNPGGPTAEPQSAWDFHKGKSPARATCAAASFCSSSLRRLSEACSGPSAGRSRARRGSHS